MAALLGLAACGSPANNSALFSTSGSPAIGSGGGASESGGGSGNSSPGGNSGAASTGSGGTMPSGGVGAGGTSAGGASGGSAPSGGAPGGGAPSGGSAGSAGAGMPNGGGGSGGMVGDCSADGPGATYYAETNHCYLVVQDMATFAQAKAHCASLNAHLVTLSSQQENDFVWSLDTNEHWIGTTDGKGPRENTPGTYTWVDGEPFTYTNWSAGQPNASQTTCTDGMGGGNCYEHCGFQWSGGAEPGEWNDRLCTHMIEAVCEWDQ